MKSLVELYERYFFGDLNVDRTGILSQTPISRIAIPNMRTGDKVAFFAKDEIREGLLVYRSETSLLDAETILSKERAAQLLPNV